MLAAQRQSKEIDGVTYHVLPLGGMASLMVAARFMKMASPAFSDVGQLMKISTQINSALELLASGVLEDLDVDFVSFAATELARVTDFEVAGARRPIIAENSNVFDEHFRGRFMSMLKWLAFAASVTYPFEKAPPKPPVSADPPAAG